MKYILLLTLLLTTLYANKNEILAQVIKIDGEVKLLRAKALKKTDANLGDFLYQKDMLITLKDAKAIVMLADGSKVILSESSKLKMLKKSELTHEAGKIYYKIKKRKNRGLNVKTKFAVIGVKGTKFIINDEKGDQGVMLKEGLVGVSALQGEFELYQKKVMDEFEAYKAKLAGEFEAYKESLNEEFVSYVKSFDLKPGKAIRFNGNVVKEQSFEEVESAFKAFESFE